MSKLVCFFFPLVLDYNPVCSNLNFLLLKPYFLSFGCFDAFHNLISYAKWFMTTVLFNNIGFRQCVLQSAASYGFSSL